MRTLAKLWPVLVVLGQNGQRNCIYKHVSKASHVEETCLQNRGYVCTCSAPDDFNFRFATYGIIRSYTALKTSTCELTVPYPLYAPTDCKRKWAPRQTMKTNTCKLLASDIA